MTPEASGSFELKNDIRIVTTLGAPDVPLALSDTQMRAFFGYFEVLAGETRPTSANPPPPPPLFSITDSRRVAVSG
jgi:hypothetical protein